MNHTGEQLPESNQGEIITVNAVSTKIYGLEAQGMMLVGESSRIDLTRTRPCCARFVN